MRFIGATAAAMGLVLAAGTIGACSVKVAGNDQVAATPTPAPRDSFAQFRDGFIEGWFKLDPANAVYQGRHDFDGQLPDWSAAGLKRQSEFLHQAINRAEKFGDSLSPQEAFERDYLIKIAQGKLFWLDDADQPHTNPAYYVGGGLDPNVYIARPYADAPTRMKAVIAFMRNIPAAAKNIRANLKTPMPLSFVNYGVAGFNGFADYYTGDAKAAFAGVEDKQLHADLDLAAQQASDAMRELGTWLEGQRETATQDFALGPDRFAQMLMATEGVDTPLADLEAVGRADLKRNQDALAAACNQFAKGQTIPACIAKMSADKAADGPVAEARRQIPELRQFVEAKDLVTIPGTEEAKVEESPPL